MNESQTFSQQYPPPAPSYGQSSYGQSSYGQAPTSSAGSTADDRTWATIAHAGSFIAAWIALGIVCPILTLVAKPNRPFVREHAYESLNFQLNAAALWLIFVVFGAVTLGIGYVVLAIPAAIYVVFYTVCVLRAAFAANRGEMYRYPLTVRVFNS